MSLDNTSNTPTVPPGRSLGQRRAHTKSSNGCTQCKARRVKCDEIHPICSRCVKRSAPCSFQSQGSTHTSSDSPIGSSVQPSPTCPEFDVENTRIIELKLIHQYSTSTCIVLSQNVTDVSFHNNVAIKLSFSNPFLLHAILATAAIHLSTVETDKTEFWLHLGMQYHNRAITGFNDALKNPESFDPAALSLCSMSMVINSLSLSTEKLRGEAIDAVAELIRTRALLQGVITILGQVIEELRLGYLDRWRNELIAEAAKTNDGVFNSLVTHIDSTRSIPGHWGIFFSKFSKFAEFQEKSLEFYQKILERIKQMATWLDGEESENQVHYRNSCALLLGAMEVLHWDRGNIIAWPMLISESMISFLEARDDIASLIFLHYGVALYLSTLHCFSKGAGRHLVETLAKSLEKTRPEWIEVLDWARASVLRDM